MFGTDTSVQKRSVQQMVPLQPFSKPARMCRCVVTFLPLLLSVCCSPLLARVERTRPQHYRVSRAHLARPDSQWRAEVAAKSWFRAVDAPQEFVPRVRLHQEVPPYLAEKQTHSSFCEDYGLGARTITRLHPFLVAQNSASRQCCPDCPPTPSASFLQSYVASRMARSASTRTVFKAFLPSYHAHCPTPYSQITLWDLRQDPPALRHISFLHLIPAFRPWAPCQPRPAAAVALDPALNGEGPPSVGPPVDGAPLAAPPRPLGERGTGEVLAGTSLAHVLRLDELAVPLRSHRDQLDEAIE